MGNRDLVIAFLEKRLGGDASGHSLDHAYRVERMALHLASIEGGDIEVISFASLLHDTVDEKLFSDIDEAYSILEDFLSSIKIDESKKGHILEIIKTMSWHKRDELKKDISLEQKIVMDADKLDALGAIGIARTFQFGGSRGRSLDENIAHFHEKLLLLEENMLTDEGRRIAHERSEYIKRYLDELNKEINLER